MGFFKSIGDAIYREYDRRIRRASLVTEYGAQHHAHADEHAADEPPVAADTAAPTEEEEEAEIVNVPRGTPVANSERPAAKDTAST